MGIEGVGRERERELRERGSERLGVRKLGESCRSWGWGNGNLKG